ncbi:MAG: MFS transporter [Thermoplasmatales archaeon]
MKAPPGRDRWFLSYFPMNTSAGITSPLAPLFITEILAGGAFEYSLYVIVASLATILGLIVWGSLSDKMGKRKMFIYIGFISLAVTSVMFSISFNIEYFIFVSFLSGFLGSAVTPVSSILIMELAERKDWSMKISKFSQYNSYGNIAGVIFSVLFTGAFPRVSELRYLYLISAVFYVGSVVLGHVYIPESQKKIERDEVPIRTFRVFERVRYLPTQIIHFNFHFKVLDRDLKFIIVGFLIMMTGFQLFFVEFPIMLTSNLGVSSSVYFMIYLGNYLFGAITFGFSGQTCKKYGNRKVATMAVIARIIIFPSTIALVALLTFRPLLFVGLLLIFSLLGALWAFISVGTATLVSNLSKPEERGRVSGTYNAVQSFGAVIGSAMTGLIVLRFGFYVDYAIASAVVIVGLLIFLREKTK